MKNVRRKHGLVLVLRNGGGEGYGDGEVRRIWGGDVKTRSWSRTIPSHTPISH